MPYIAQAERREEAAKWVMHLAANPAFMALCDTWVSDLVDEHLEMLKLDAPDVYRAQGRAIKLRETLETMFGAARVRERFIAATNDRLRQDREEGPKAVGRQSYQP